MATNPIAHKHNYANGNVSLTKPNQQLNECLTFMNYKIFIEIIYCETATYIHAYMSLCGRFHFELEGFTQIIMFETFEIFLTRVYH